MRRMFMSVLCALLAVILLVPSVAFAGPGNGRGNGKGLDKAARAGDGADDAEEALGKGRDKSEKEKPWKLEAGSETEAEEGSADEPGEEPGDGDKVRERVRERYGIANALERIQANIAKAEAKVLAGTKKQVPPGLLRVLAKFMGWLGITPEEPPADGTIPPDGDGVEDPGDDVDDPGSGEPTDTVEPEEPGDAGAEEPVEP